MKRRNFLQKASLSTISVVASASVVACKADLEKNNSINSTYNGIALTIDMLDGNPDKVRLFVLRSFGESLYHSITDASLEFGFKSI